MPGRVAVVVLLLVASIGSASATLRAPFASGDVAADGVGVATITQLRARNAHDVAFIGRSDAILVGRAGTLSVLAATGGALPSPFAGTFNELGAPTFTASGTIVFSASVNTPVAHSGIFVAGPEGVTAIALRHQAVGALSVNRTGDVVIRDGGIMLWEHDTKTETPVAGRRDALFDDERPLVRFFARPVIGPTRAVVFGARGRSRREGLFLWRPSSGVAALVSGSGHPALRGWRFEGLRRAPVSINATEQVAFVADFCVDAGDCGSGVFRVDPMMGSIDVVARTREQVGGGIITRISDDFVGIDDAGEVAFIARLGSSQFLFRSGSAGLTRVAPIGGTGGMTPGLEDWRLTAWLDDGAVLAFDGVVQTLVPPDFSLPAAGFRPRDVEANSAGDVTFLASRSAYYRVRRGLAEPVLIERNELPDVGIVADPQDADARYVGKELLVLAPLLSGAYALGRATPEGLVALVVPQMPTPLGGTFDLGADTLIASDTAADALLFVAGLGMRQGVGLFSLRPTGEVNGLLASDALGIPTLQVVTLVPGGGDEPIVAISFGDGESALVAIDALGPRVLIRSGDLLPGRQVLARLEVAAVSPRRALFLGFVEGNAEPAGLFARARKTRASIRPLLRVGGSAPGGGKVTSLRPRIHVSGAGVAVDRRNRTTVFGLRGSGLVELLRSEGQLCDASGRTADLSSASVADRRAIALGYLEPPNATPDTSFPRALFEGTVHGTCPLAVAGQRTPLGGTLGPFGEDLPFVSTAEGVVFTADIVAGRARSAIWAAKRQRRADSTRSTAIVSTITAITTGQFPNRP
jgi:hypothetical protein